MSKHNYSQYSNKTKKNGEVNSNYTPLATTPEVKMELEHEMPVPAVELVQETVNTVTPPETITGDVVNCAKLNVRANPSTTADIVCVLDAATEIRIDVNESNDEWFKVCTATNIEGYCMRKFINARL